MSFSQWICNTLHDKVQDAQWDFSLLCSSVSQTNLCLKPAFFFLRDCWDLISCAQYFALSSVSPFMRRTHQVLAASSDCQPPREAGGIGRKLFNGTGSFMWVKGRFTAWFPLVSAATLHHNTIFSALIPFGWLLRGEDRYICKWH